MISLSREKGDSGAKKKKKKQKKKKDKSAVKDPAQDPLAKVPPSTLLCSLTGRSS